jgi:phage gpG-like protein
MKGLDKRVRSVLETSLIVIGNEAKNHFVNSFRLQGFEDKTVEKWKPRKKKEAKGRGSKKSAAEAGTVRSVKAGRAILVKSGDLRRSIRREPVNKAAMKVTIATDLVYARIHNEGLMGKAWGKAPFKMPKRQFIGGSFTLNTKVKKTITKSLDRLFKK